MIFHLRVTLLLDSCPTTRLPRLTFRVLGRGARFATDRKCPAVRQGQNSVGRATLLQGRTINQDPLPSSDLFVFLFIVMFNELHLGSRAAILSISFTVEEIPGERLRSSQVILQHPFSMS